MARKEKIEVRSEEFKPRKGVILRIIIDFEKNNSDLVVEINELDLYYNKTHVSMIYANRLDYFVNSRSEITDELIAELKEELFLAHLKTIERAEKKLRLEKEKLKIFNKFLRLRKLNRITND